jgi:hypothetical protein
MGGCRNPPTCLGSVLMYLEEGPNRIPCIMVLILYEEGINQFFSMAFFGGMISKGEVSI